MTTRRSTNKAVDLSAPISSSNDSTQTSSSIASTDNLIPAAQTTRGESKAKKTMEGQRKRVLVVGAGAAGMACADGLARHPDKFDVTMIDAQAYCGGQAFSIPIDKSKYGSEWMNQGVQGGSYIYQHTFHHFQKLGYEAKPVELQVSFGKGDKFWSNLFPTHLVEKHAKDIKRFGTAIRWMRHLEVVFALIPIKVTLKMWGLSEEFINYMIYPSLALFLGTGNATPDLPSVMMERLYTSPTYGMWYPVDEKSLSSNLPPMVVFPESTKFYRDWQRSLEDQGVKVRLNTELTKVKSRSPSVRVLLRSRRQSEDMHNPNMADQDLPETEEVFDEIVFCVLADTAKRVLGNQARWTEKIVLGQTKWSDDVTVTHNDIDYIRKYYTIDFDKQQATAQISGRDDSARYKKGEDEFRPMYLIKQVPADARKLEMCFDCNAFQYQLAKDTGPEDHVYQTIFLNKKHKDTWQKDEIRQDKILRVDWWHQLCHAWTHYAFVVPFVWALNWNCSHTTYAGAWTLVNAHEVAIISGQAAAYKLGADYPAELYENEFARKSFKSYLWLTHLMGLKKSRTS
ncbi:FAD/NAD(P)-binding domain-containing protein [Naematelia encephala]|uniref:FAD/NAD(P)-binding domain-containing protein n=1 Tax=Naematelia encephala TaxID=71784 RepID=A0A1Y2B8D6_9TREE|nr:FAD/NAD(P)-binding domain-containing protein [Naematelia encephala]